MTPDKLKLNTRKELAELAKQHQVAGWHGMRKDELIEALMDVFRTPEEPAATGRNRSAVTQTATKQSAESRISMSLNKASARRTSKGSFSRKGVNGQRSPGSNQPRAPRKDLSTVSDNEQAAEELTTVAHDPHWLHVRWVLKRSTVQRAAAGLGYEWHQAKPVLRLNAIELDESRSAKTTWISDTPIHGEVDHWFLPVQNPPGTYRVEIGYVTPSGKFFALAKSRRVSTPRPGTKAAERPQFNAATGASLNQRMQTQRPVASDPEFEKFLSARAVSFAVENNQMGGLGAMLDVNMELVISGNSHPNAQVTVMGEAQKVGRDGRFTLKVPFEEGRQVIPAVAISPDGTEQRTVLLAVERNTKELDPQVLADA
ncbi:DUF4912 domain-containing protein [Calycomorphotria hydatis]|uniref:Rho termination factor N-terminal domain-containing protein n=1 Tax=Calycomorphotria hydatis TaxID=2528027 RepID=A0A517T6F8_9PLAN|nr:DUF4912 domain-containing protein [Calycomorphotria hydatis]QDT63963.1 hypothetical protein V22_11930 [Calycomorphotria hydatis]